MKPHRTNQKGFTLIELLVVVAIIGLLSSIVLANLQGARSLARDTKRIAEMKSIEKALTLYALDNGGYVPKSDFSDINEVPMSDGVVDCNKNNTNTEFLYDVLVPKYLSSRPTTDPQQSLGYCYVYISSGVATYVAGAEYDTDGNLVTPKVLAWVDDSEKRRNAIFFAASENTKTLSGNQATVGISFGSQLIQGLNINLTTGIKSNVSGGSVDTSGSY